MPSSGRLPRNERSDHHVQCQATLKEDDPSIKGHLLYLLEKFRISYS